MLATLGDIDFNVSEGRILTYQDINFTHASSYAEHAILNRKALLEYTGDKPSTCSLKIALNIAQGIVPEQIIKKLRNHMNKHEAIAFTIGGDVMGQGLWVIENMTEAHTLTGSKGEIISAEISLNLKEYVNNNA